MFSQEQQYPINEYYMGLDLGQPNKYTALAIVAATTGYRGFNAGGHFVDNFYEPDEIKFKVVHLERFKLGTPYPALVKQVSQRAAGLKTTDKPTLAVDVTGTGQAVLDLLLRAELNPVAINMTGGGAIAAAPHGYNLPKKDLISNLQVLMQERRLQVAPGLDLGQMLAEEMANFKFKVALAALDSYSEWREGDKDDLVFAVGVAVWLANYRHKNELRVLGPGDDLFDLLTNFTGN